MKKDFHLVVCLCTLLLTPALYAEPDTDPKLPLPDFSAWEDRIKHENSIEENPYAMAFFKPTYILPYYHTFNPDTAIYQYDTPNNQKVKANEFKAQLSFKMPLLKNILNRDELNLSAAYTQVSYWQVYASSQYFRETNYEPELFLSSPLTPLLFGAIGINHQSNGRGGQKERSWNRAYTDFTFAKNDWVVDLKIWALLFKRQTSDIHNKDIVDYMGHEELMGAYRFGKNTFSITLRNLLHFHQGATTVAWSHEFAPRVNIYLQLFSGYGQSLIEYNHRTNSAGIGIALSDWL